MKRKSVLANLLLKTLKCGMWDACDHFLADTEIPFTPATESPDSFLCHYCPDDDSIGSAAAKKANTMMLDVITPVKAFSCRHCPDDDSMGSQFNLESLDSNAFDKKAVEVAFCNKISKSVSDELGATNSCSRVRLRLNKLLSPIPVPMLGNSS